MAVYLPLALSALFGLAAPGLARRLPPALGSWLLSLGAVLSAAASSVSLGLLAVVFLARYPLAGARGHWSETALRAQDPYPLWLGALATTAVAVCAIGFVRVLLARVAATRAAHRLATHLGGGPATELTVLDSPTVDAFAVPGRPGRIVATTALLRDLSAPQRRAVLAHERAHLTHRHHLHQTAVRLAAAVNPLLRALPAATALACERWADEAAARDCPRGTVAEALTRAAAGARGPRPAAVPHAAVPHAAVLRAAATAIAARIAALREPPPRPATWRLAALAALSLASLAAIALALQDTDRLFDLAESAYRTGLR